VEEVKDLIFEDMTISELGELKLKFYYDIQLPESDIFKAIEIEFIPVTSL
jgi:hypothetical protein